MFGCVEVGNVNNSQARFWGSNNSYQKERLATCADFQVLLPSKTKKIFVFCLVFFLFYYAIYVSFSYQKIRLYIYIYLCMFFDILYIYMYY